MQPAPYFRKVTTNKDGRPRKQRKGWGRFQSVLRERSADFNLTLDVQNLRQEVQNLTTLRDVLSTQSLVQRHSPEGSLSRMVNEYFRVFRKGTNLQEVGRKRLVDEVDQCAFMHRIMDEKVDVGNGLCGPDVMMQQMATYSKFMRFICMSGQVHSIVTADDSVLISVRGSLLFQVMRSTIEMVFPHIMGDAWLVAQLVGKEVKALARSTFHFNSSGKCFKYDVEMDFVGAFLSIVKDPLVVDVLLRRALIGDNAMLGVVDEPVVPEEKETSVAASVDMAESYHELENHGQQSEGVARQKLNTNRAQRTAGSNSSEFCQRIVEDYFSAFANGFRELNFKGPTTPSGVMQREFFLHRFATPTEGTAKHVRERWCALSECFEVLGFQQKGVSHIECGHSNNMCLAESAARYILCITFHAIHSVFPHLVSDMPLLDAIVDKVIMVPSNICFSVEKRTGRVTQIDEEMDFTAALAELVPDRKELSFVISRALLTRDGVNYSKIRLLQPIEELNSVQQKKPLPPLNQVQDESFHDSQSGSRTMNIADILG